MVIKVKRKGSSSWLQDAEYTLEEEIEIYNLQLQDILDNTRWYLDNLDFMKQYKVRWHDYKKGRTNTFRAVLPYSKQ